MRCIIHGEIYSENFDKVSKLITDWSSACRFAFCRFQKDKLSFNEVRKQTKIKYLSLNTRQISDTIRQAQGLYERVKDKKVIFGGRKAWNKVVSGELSNEEWKERRDKQLYAQGDITKQGNPNLRLLKEEDGSYWLRITVGNKQFEKHKLFIPDKFKDKTESLLSLEKAYNVRVIKKDKQHYKVMIDYKIENPKTKITFDNGVIGVDSNSDRLAISEVSRDGNLINSFSIVDNKIFFASTHKRDYEIGCMVKQIIQYALDRNKGMVFENLRFKKEFENQGKKFNRAKSTFVWRKILALLERKCIEFGIMYKKVNPAFTSIIGRFKYQKMYNLNIHESAAYVIGRRGLGFNEKLSLYKYPSALVKKFIIRTLAGKYDSRRIHSWMLWRKLRDDYRATLTALRGGMSNLKEFDGNPRYIGESPVGESVIRIGRSRIFNIA